MLMRYSWKWSAGLQVRQSNSQLVQEIHSFLLNSNINTVLYFCCTLLLEEHLCHSRWKKMWWALVCAADTDSNMGVEMVSVSWCIFVLRSGKERNIFFPFYLPLASFPPKDKWSFHTVDDVNNVGLHLWGRAGSCWLCGWGCWRAGVTRGNCPETLGCDLPDISPRCLSRSPSLWTVSPWGKMERGEERLKGGKTEGLGRMVWK